MDELTRYKGWKERSTGKEVSAVIMFDVDLEVKNGKVEVRKSYFLNKEKRKYISDDGTFLEVEKYHPCPGMDEKNRGMYAIACFEYGYRQKHPSCWHLLRLPHGSNVVLFNSKSEAERAVKAIRKTEKYDINFEVYRAPEEIPVIRPEDLLFRDEKFYPLQDREIFRNFPVLDPENQDKRLVCFEAMNEVIVYKTETVCGGSVIIGYYAVRSLDLDWFGQDHDPLWENPSYLIKPL